MSLDRFQNLLSRLATDKTFRQDFFRDREAVLRSEVWTEIEAQNLQYISQTQVERFAHSLQIKRQTEVKELIPFSLTQLGDRFAPLFARHGEIYRPTGLLKPGNDAHQFLLSLARNREFSPLSREVFRLEAFRLSHCASGSQCPFGLFRCCLCVSSSHAYTISKGWTFCLLRNGATYSRSFGRSS